jgi:Protein of unknown function (DUF4232)
MRPARIMFFAVVVAGAVAVAGCGTRSTASEPAAAPKAPREAPAVGPEPADKPSPPSGGGAPTPPSTPDPPGGPPGPGRCDASALRGSVVAQEGAAGTIWTTVRLRNLSGSTCTVRGIPEVRLLGDQGQPLTAPSVPGGPAGAPVVLRPGQAARFAFSAPNACDAHVAGSRLRVTLPAGRGSLVVPLGAVTSFGTCASVGVRALEAWTGAITPTAPRDDRISDPQVAADRLVAAWMRGDRAAAGRLTTPAVVERLFSEAPPAAAPEALPCRLVAGQAVFVCSYPIAERAEVSLFVEGGASAGYRVVGVEFGD